jgi:hypothetical protein
MQVLKARPNSVRQLIVAFVAVSALFMGASASAQAAGCSEANARTYAYQLDYSIIGIGGFWGCSTRPVAGIKLQQYRGLGYWRTLKTAYGSFTPNRDVRLSWNCRGTGWQTYRTQMWGLTIGGEYWDKKSSEVRRYC